MMTKKFDNSKSDSKDVNLSKENAIKHLKNVLAHSIKRERTLDQIIRSFK